MSSRRPGKSGARPKGERRSRRRRWGRRTAGAVLGVVVLVLLGWVAYQYFFSNLVAAVSYRQQVSALRSSWQQSSAPPATDQPAPGSVVAVMRVPAFGAGYEVPVLAGTSKDLLTRGVGLYRGNAAPGQVGNCALAGLRVTHGQPFTRLHELGRGARVVLETRRAVFTYVVDVPPRDLTVHPGDSWVLQPVPGQPGARPSQALLTLTTAQDVLPTADRSVGFAHLASTQNKS